MKKLVILFIIFLALILGIIFLLSFLTQDKTPSTITPSITITPTVRQDELRVINSLPREASDQSFLPFQKITLSFNDSVDPKTMPIEISPPVEVNVIQGENPQEVLIIPKSFWTNGTTTLTIPKGTRSIFDRTLLAPFTYTLKTAVPTLSKEEIESDAP